MVVKEIYLNIKRKKLIFFFSFFIIHLRATTGDFVIPILTRRKMYSTGLHAVPTPSINYWFLRTAFDLENTKKIYYDYNLRIYKHVKTRHIVSFMVRSKTKLRHVDYWYQHFYRYQARDRKPEKIWKFRKTVVLFSWSFEKKVYWTEQKKKRRK